MAVEFTRDWGGATRVGVVWQLKGMGSEVTRCLAERQGRGEPGALNRGAGWRVQGLEETSKEGKSVWRNLLTISCQLKCQSNLHTSGTVWHCLIMCLLRTRVFTF